MNSLFSHILDFIFPPSTEALELRALSPGEIFTKLPHAELLPFSFITPLLAYKHPLTSELIHSIKNRRNQHAFRLGGFALYQKLKEIPGQVVLVPIPLSKRRLRERGYNQCELLIDEVLKLDREKKLEKNLDILKRTKHTTEQKLKNRSERLSESRNIFSANKTSLTYPIVLIDDVVTTGATLKEAYEVLLSAGYMDVSAFTLAH